LKDTCLASFSSSFLANNPEYIPHLVNIYDSLPPIKSRFAMRIAGLLTVKVIPSELDGSRSAPAGTAVDAPR
jgi:hypothetical protein